jgi:hypothetical protein
MAKNGEHASSQVHTFRLFLIFFLPVLALWIVNLLIPFIFMYLERSGAGRSVAESYSKDNLARTGTFGDTFGAVNSLFSGLAFAGVAVAVVFQWRELRHLEEQTAIARRQTTVADQQSKEAEEERKRAERYASLTACLNAATSLAESSSRSMEFTMMYSENIIPLSGAKYVKTTRSRNVIAERDFRKYTQIQRMLFFEIQNFDMFYREQRDILSLKTKKEYFGNFIRSILLEWQRYQTEKIELLRAGGQAFSPDKEYTPNDWLMTQVHQQLRVIWSEAVTFLSQEGVKEATFALTLSGNLKRLETLLDKLLALDDGNDEAVRAFFLESYSVIESFDISHFQV